MVQRLSRVVLEMTTALAGVLKSELLRQGEGSSLEELFTLWSTWIGAPHLQAQERRAAQRDEANDALRAQASQLRSILAALGDAVVAVSYQGEILLANPEAERVFGAGLNEARGGASGLFLPDQITPVPPEDHPLARAMRGESHDGQELFVRGAASPDGAWMTAATRPLRLPDGALGGGVIVLHESTARRRAEVALRGSLDALERQAAELAEAQRKLGEAARLAGLAEVATAVLHDVGNVLSGVNHAAARVRTRVTSSRLAALDDLTRLVRAHEHDLAGFVASDERGRRLPDYIEKLFEQFVLERDEVKASLDVVDKGMDHLRDLIGVQQSYARGRSRLDRVPPAELIEDALILNASGIQRCGVEIVRDYADVGPVLLDRHKVLQILVNLVNNAVRALSAAAVEPRRLTLRLGLHGASRVRIEVCDNGVGLHPADIPRLFDYGFTTRSDGHGFGLYSCMLAARDIRGTLTAESGGPGEGATFTLEFALEPGVHAP